MVREGCVGSTGSACSDIARLLLLLLLVQEMSFVPQGVSAQCLTHDLTRPLL